MLPKDDHDRECGQNLACLIIQLHTARHLRQSSPERSDAALDDALYLAKACLEQVRERVSALNRSAPSED